MFNAKEAFTDIANKIKAIMTRLNSEADYIVATGTSGIWRYEKWNSGKAVLYGVYTLTNGSFSATGNVYYRTVTGLSFPTDFFNTTPYYVSGTTSMGNVNAFSGSGLYQTEVSFVVLSAVSTARTVTVYLEVRGTWK